MDFDLFDLSVRGVDSPMVFDAIERTFWLDLWRAPVLDAVIDEHIERRWYGPIQVTAVAGQPESPMVNLLLGAAEPGVVGEGHLAAALDWVDSLGLDCRVPLDPGRDEAAAAEELLSRWGYERAESQVRLVRDASPPDFPAPEGIEVIEVEEFAEGFGELFGEGFGLEGSTGWLFDCLPGRHPWHCYLALDGDGRPRAAAVTMTQWNIAAFFGLAATAADARGKGFHMALLHRRILDAGKHWPTLFAETTEPLGERDGPSPGCRNLLRAGFKQASVRSSWRRKRG